MKYYSQEQIKELIPDKIIKEFDKFMFGQTCGMVDCWNCKDGKDELTGFNNCTICNGKGWLLALYKHDVDRFLVRNNIEPVEGIELC